MLIKSFILLILFLTVSLYADKNWIKIEQTNKVSTSKLSNKVDLNLSKVKPLNNIIKSVVIVKQFIDNQEKVKENINNKSWFVLDTPDSN